MALLKHALDGAKWCGARRWRAGGVLALAGIASITGCFVLESLGLRERPLEFSHEAHLAEGLDCASCHATYEDGDTPSWPAPAQCALCHADLDAEKAPERRVEALFVDGVFQAQHAAAVSDEVVFSHETHMSAGASCEQCHAGIETATRVDAALAVSMDDCLRCHSSLGLPTDNCSMCHTRMSLETPPPNHAHEWTRLHGIAVRGGFDGPANACSMCHTEQTCVTCHRDESPANHNNLWRTRTHGVVAAMDRDSCATCHTPDSCSRCHAETEPLSHHGPFGAPMDTHCMSCHVPLKAESCFVCHKDTNSHLDAAPKPSVPPHSPALDCRSCHGVTESLPHVDNGDDCNSCHF